MNKRLEKKILEELKQRVLERDKQLQEQGDRDDLRDATKEALSDLTSLSREEVDAIERRVQAEEQRKFRRRRNLIITFAVIGGLIVFIFAIASLTRKPNIKITDTFDDNKMGWAMYNDFEYDRHFENGSYIIQTNEDDYCYWDNIKVDFPENYTIEAGTTWKKGKFNGYGLVLLEASKKYAAFSIRADRKAIHDIYYIDEWKKSATWKLSSLKKGDGKTQNVQRIDVQGNNFKYYINNELFEEGKLSYLQNIRYIGCRVCDLQTVAFDYLKITDNTTNEIILDEDFVDAQNGWEPKNKFTKRSKIEDGMYVFSGNTEDHCYWTSTEFRIEDDFEVILKSKWESGETSNYGLMMMQDDDNYFSCELKNNGETRLVTCYNGEYTSVPEYTMTSNVSDGSNIMEQKVVFEDNKISYYLNNQLIDSKSTYFQLDEVGLRVCGLQTVGFDYLEINELD